MATMHYRPRGLNEKPHHDIPNGAELQHKTTKFMIDSLLSISKKFGQRDSLPKPNVNIGECQSFVPKDAIEIIFESGMIRFIFKKEGIYFLNNSW